MRCPNCEKLNPDSAQHCAYCGATLTPPAASSSPRARRPEEGLPPTSPPPPPARRGGPLLWGIVALVLLAIAATALITHALSGGSSQPKAQAAAPPAVVTRVVTVQVPVTVTVLVPVTPTSAPVTATPSSTPAPTATPAATPAPAASVAATAAPATTVDTPPGTVLEVGQTWHQGGMDLQLSSVSLDANGVVYRLTLTNRRPDQVILRFTLGDVFSVTDNLGRRLSLDSSDHIYTLTLNPNDSSQLQTDPGYDPYAREDLTSPSVTQLTITATGISSITNARWHLLIHH